MNHPHTSHGFLPEYDPPRAFPGDSELVMLDELGHDLPSLLEDAGFRKFARDLQIPPWPTAAPFGRSLPLLGRT